MHRGLALLLSFALAPVAGAEPLLFTDEAAYLAALEARGDCVVEEGFEDDLAWGDVRSGVPGGNHVAPSVTRRGVTWLPNNATSGVTTSNGAAVTGDWGFYELPHGDYVNGKGDGWVTTADGTFTAAGGWIRTNTPYAAIDFLIDDAIVADFEDVVLGTTPLFYGVIDPAGFQRIEVRELEGAIDDQKLLFADDFTLGFSPVCPGHVFADGFEDGTTDAWTLPPT